MITVIKLGGRVQADPGLVSAVVARWKEDPGALCIVHGGGDEISALQQRLGVEPKFVTGRRITTQDDLELVRMVLSGSANKRLVGAFRGAGVEAVGISGEDGGLLTAEPIDAGLFGRSGRPTAVNARVLEVLLAAGFLPVISPVGIDSSSVGGEAININGDDAAAAIAAALCADLLLIADVGGVMDADRTILRAVDEQTVKALVAEGTVNKGMHAKLEAGFSALAAGATSARIANVDAIIDSSSGTSLTRTSDTT